MHVADFSHHRGFWWGHRLAFHISKAPTYLISSTHPGQLQIQPDHADAHHNLGVAFSDLGEREKAKLYLKKTIQISPNYKESYWGLHGFSSNIDEALIVLKKALFIDNNFFKEKAMIGALHGFKGNFKDVDALIASPEAINNHITRSIKYVFSLPKLPKIFFNQWDFFDAVVALTDKLRPFYEFGVWNGSSFQYLINTFGKGFGFDTFTGLPEPWHTYPKGAYSSFGSVPEITGGEFIVGKFEETLPIFFPKKDLWHH